MFGWKRECLGGNVKKTDGGGLNQTEWRVFVPARPDDPVGRGCWLADDLYDGHWVLIPLMKKVRERILKRVRGRMGV